MSTPNPGNVRQAVPFFLVTSMDASLRYYVDNMWVTSLTDPDGYRLDFESMTDAPEESECMEEEEP